MLTNFWTLGEWKPQAAIHAHVLNYVAATACVQPCWSNMFGLTNIVCFVMIYPDCCLSLMLVIYNCLGFLFACGQIAFCVGVGCVAGTAIVLQTWGQSHGLADARSISRLGQASQGLQFKCSSEKVFWSCSPVGRWSMSGTWLPCSLAATKCWSRSWRRMMPPTPWTASCFLSSTR